MARQIEPTPTLSGIVWRRRGSAVLRSSAQLTARVAQEEEEEEEELTGSGPAATAPESSTSALGGNGPIDDAPLPHKLLTRQTASMILVVIDLAVLGLTLADVHGSVRLVLGLVLGGFIPGWSVVGLFKLGHPALELSLTVGMSFVLLMLAALVLMTVHEWHLQGLEEVTCVLCFPLLLRQCRPWGT